ncbi:hypothetical protein HDU77_003104 [Chytriomyces hyalinus]|nr:hypothetical protein HDU77_003104 [Chytriomyces hyalinus]
MAPEPETLSEKPPLDPARPAVLTVSVRRVVSDTACTSLHLRLKLRTESVWITPNAQTDFLVTLHAVTFDQLKIDVFNGASSSHKSRSRTHLGRGRVALSEMPDWHWGSYSKTVNLVSPRDPSKSIGFAEIDVSFSPVIHPEETITSYEQLRDFMSKVAVEESQDDTIDGTASARTNSNNINSNNSSTDEFKDIFSEDSENEAGDASEGVISPSTEELGSGVQSPTSPNGSILKLHPNPATRNHFLRATTLHEVRALVGKPTSISPVGNARKHSLDSTEVSGDSILDREIPGEEKSKSVSLTQLTRAKTSSFHLKSLFTRGSSRRGSADKSIETEDTESVTNASKRESPEPLQFETDSLKDLTALVKAPTILKLNAKPKMLKENAHNNLKEVNELTMSLLKNDFNMPVGRVVKVVKFLYKFENGLPIPRTGNIIKEVGVFDDINRLLDHSLVVYGSVMFGFVNSSMSLRDNFRLNADEKTAVEHLGLLKENVLFWDHSKREMSSSRYYIMHDTALNAIVISVQGTISAAQIVTDLNAEYFAFQNGSAHRGMLRSAQQIVEKHLLDLLEWSRSLGVAKIFCTGHSLGAGVGALLTILLNEKLDLFVNETQNPDFNIHGHCFATPGVVTRPVAEKYESSIDNYVMESDTIPRLSVGTFLAFKEMVIEASTIMDQKLPDEEAYDALQVKREEILIKYNDKLGMIPGKVYHLYKTVRKVPRRHQTRLNIQEPVFKTAYRTMPLPESEKPDVPHYVMELARAEFFAYIAPRRHILNHHMPWSYSKSIRGARDWIMSEEANS